MTRAVVSGTARSAPAIPHTQLQNAGAGDGIVGLMRAPQVCRSVSLMANTFRNRQMFLFEIV